MLRDLLQDLDLAAKVGHVSFSANSQQGLLHNFVQKIGRRMKNIPVTRGVMKKAVKWTSPSIDESRPNRKEPDG